MFLLWWKLPHSQTPLKVDVHLERWASGGCVRRYIICSNTMLDTVHICAAISRLSCAWRAVFEQVFGTVRIHRTSHSRHLRGGRVHMLQRKEKKKPNVHLVPFQRPNNTEFPLRIMWRPVQFFSEADNWDLALLFVSPKSTYQAQTSMVST